MKKTTMILAILIFSCMGMMAQVKVGKYKEWKKTISIINELKEWFKGYHKSYASCKWYEEDYIEFIEHLENELKGVNK